MNTVTIDARNTDIGLDLKSFRHFVASHCVDPDLLYEITIRIPSNEIVTLQCNSAFLEEISSHNGLGLWYDFVNNKGNNS